MEYTFDSTTGVIDLRNKDKWRYIPFISAGLYPSTGNTCVVEITLADDPNNVDAVWHEWSLGQVTSATMDVFFAVATGIRARRTAGSANNNKLIVLTSEG